MKAAAAVLLLALLWNSVPVLSQEPPARFQMAQPAQTPPPPPPVETPPKPRTATPSEDTGMAGQVAGGAFGGLSSGILLSIFTVIGIAALATVSSSDNDTSPSAPTTTTR